MPVMKKLTVGGVTYDTVGEASVTQFQQSGTKIATVTIDGTSTDLYAPSGGSSVTPSSSTPAMDGTASAGSSTDYARGDHVHPTDTSRQAALVSGTNIKTVNNTSLLGSGNISVASSSHTHGSIDNTGAITSDTTVASGDKLVIADSSDSSKLKRSGIAFGSSTSTFLRNDGTWAEPSGGGGGGWVDVSQDVMDAMTSYPEIVYFYAYTDGNLMLISCACDTTDTNSFEIQLPYVPPSYTAFIGNALDLSQGTPSVCYIESFGESAAITLGESGYLFFTLIYPLASAVS